MPDTTLLAALGAEPLVGELLARADFAPPGTDVVCALSGGPDSSALTALAVAAGCEVRAIHVDHGLRADSSTDAASAQEVASRLGVACRVERVEVAPGPNLEARAREARRGVLGPGTLTGHTLDDQAETVLLALLRGSGARGLSAIEPGPTHPILALRRSETHALCELLSLQPCDDPTNTDRQFRRNRVRHELLPLMDDIADRDVAPLIARAADLLRDDDAILDDLAQTVDPLDAVALAAAPTGVARRSLRRWLTVEGYPPSAAAIDRVLDVARGAARSCDVDRGRRIVRSAQRLRIEHISGRMGPGADGE